MVFVITSSMLSIFFPSPVKAADTAEKKDVFQFPHIVEQDQIQLELLPRSPEQISSFYEARGFPKEMLTVLSQQCFISVRLHNHRDELLWLELENWTFYNNGKPIHRKHRDEWIQFWKKMDMPMHNQATFRWTLLPEVLDFLPDEREGGNLILPRMAGNITLHATFATGENKQGKSIVIKYDKFSCAED